MAITHDIDLYIVVWGGLPKLLNKGILILNHKSKVKELRG